MKSTPVYLGGERVIDIYYRKDAVRINVKLEIRQYQIYLNDISKEIAYQKDSADPESSGGVYAFFADDDNMEYMLRKLLLDLE